MTVFRYALIYGGLAGAVAIAVIGGGLVLGPDIAIFHTMWFGELVMLVASTFIFVGVKRYRDVEKGGVIKFLPALGAGLAIAIVAAIIYALVWEAYLAATGYRFMEDYIAGHIRELKAQGVSGAELAKAMAEFDGWRALYANPPARFAMTMAEMLMPVGLAMPFITAIALMFPKVLPAR
jgi:hypothetical protein